jgi:hypothetical protein
MAVTGAQADEVNAVLNGLQQSGIVRSATSGWMQTE